MVYNDNLAMMSDLPASPDLFQPEMQELCAGQRTENGNVLVNVFLPEFQIQHVFEFDPDETVWSAKKKVILTVERELRDPYNYGLFQPPCSGKSGKFLDEARSMKDYNLSGPVAQLEFKYKRRVYRFMLKMDQRRLKKIHNKANRKQFLEHVKRNQVEKVEKLLKAGFDPNFHDSDTGETPLTIASRLQEPRGIIMALCSGGALMDFRNLKCFTPLHTAAVFSNAAAIRVLLELGASANLRDWSDYSPLYLAAFTKGTLSVVAELLLRDYSPVDIQDEHNQTELHQACRNGSDRIVDLLLFYGADINHQADLGNTALHTCASNNEITCAQTLLARGADRYLENSTNLTAGQVAVISGFKELAEIINSFDADQLQAFEDSPAYNTNRRLTGSNLLAMKNLSVSDPRIHFQKRAMTMMELSSMGDSEDMYADDISLGGRSELGHLGLSPLNSPLAEFQTRRSMGRSAVNPASSSPSASRRLLFPAIVNREYMVVKGYRAQQEGEISLNKGEIVKAAPPPPPAMSPNSQNSTMPPTSKPEDKIRTVVLSKTKKGFGFVLRGAKAAQLQKLKVDFVPTERMPGLQYLDSVEEGSVSDKAGLKAGDFLIEINSVNVVQASHETTVDLIKKSSDILAIKFSRVETFNPAGSGSGDLASHRHMDGTATLPHQSKSKPGGRRIKPNVPSSVSEAEAIESLDNALASYESHGSSHSSSNHSTPTVPHPLTNTTRVSMTHGEKERSSSPASSVGQRSIGQASNGSASSAAAKAKAKKFWQKGKGAYGAGMSRAVSQPDLMMMQAASLEQTTSQGQSLPQSAEEKNQEAIEEYYKQIADGTGRGRSNDRRALSAIEPAMGEGGPSIYHTSFNVAPATAPAAIPPADGYGSLSAASGKSIESSFRPGKEAVGTGASTVGKKAFLNRTPLPNMANANMIYHQTPMATPATPSSRTYQPPTSAAQPVQMRRGPTASQVAAMQQSQYGVPQQQQQQQQPSHYGVPQQQQQQQPSHYGVPQQQQPSHYGVPQMQSPYGVPLQQNLYGAPQQQQIYGVSDGQKKMPPPPPVRTSMSVEGWGSPGASSALLPPPPSSGPTSPDGTTFIDPADLPPPPPPAQFMPPPLPAKELTRRSPASGFPLPPPVSSGTTPPSPSPFAEDESTATSVFRRRQQFGDTTNSPAPNASTNGKVGSLDNADRTGTPSYQRALSKPAAPSAEDQLRQAIAKRRTTMEQTRPSESESESPGASTAPKPPPANAKPKPPPPTAKPTQAALKASILEKWGKPTPPPASTKPAVSKSKPLPPPKSPDVRKMSSSGPTADEADTFTAASATSPPPVNSSASSGPKNFLAMAEQTRLNWLANQNKNQPPNSASTPPTAAPKGKPAAPGAKPSVSNKPSGGFTNSKNGETTPERELNDSLSALKLAINKMPNEDEPDVGKATVNNPKPPTPSKKPQATPLKKLSQTVSSSGTTSSNGNDPRSPPPTGRGLPRGSVATAASQFERDVEVTSNAASLSPTTSGYNSDISKEEMTLVNVTSPLSVNVVNPVITTGNNNNNVSKKTAGLPDSGKAVESWNTEDVAAWLGRIGLGEYGEVFQENSIEGETLLDLTKSDLKDLGVEKIGHKVKLDKEIQKLAAAAASS